MRSRVVMALTVVTGTISTLAVNGNALYADGSFSKVNSKNDKGIARLNASTGAHLDLDAAVEP